MIKFEEILQSVGCKNQKTFLEIGPNGTPMGTMVISLIDDGKYSENFFKLCTGQEGECYCNSHLIKIDKPGEERERVTSCFDSFFFQRLVELVKKKHNRKLKNLTKNVFLFQLGDTWHGPCNQSKDSGSTGIGLLYNMSRIS